MCWTATRLLYCVPACKGNLSSWDPLPITCDMDSVKGRRSHSAKKHLRVSSLLSAAVYSIATGHEWLEINELRLLEWMWETVTSAGHVTCFLGKLLLANNLIDGRNSSLWQTRLPIYQTTGPYTRRTKSLAHCFNNTDSSSTRLFIRQMNGILKRLPIVMGLQKVCQVYFLDSFSILWWMQTKRLICKTRETWDLKKNSCLTWGGWISRH